MIASIGRRDFPDQLHRVIKQFIQIDSYVVLLFTGDQAPLVLHDLLDASERPLFYQRYLRDGAFLLSPFFVAAREREVAGFFRVVDIAPDDFFKSEYYANYYRPSATVDEACYIQPMGKRRFLLISCGRLHRDQCFSVSERNRLSEMAPVIQAAAAQHWKSAGLAQRRAPHHLPTDHVTADHVTAGHPIAGQTPHQELELGARSSRSSRNLGKVLESFGDGCLTDRERQVALMLLRGHSSKSAARALDISPATERVHRRNIYLKLAVSSQAELCSRFFELLSH